MTQLALIGLLWRSALLLWQSDTFHATSSRRLPLNLITLIANSIMTLVLCRQVPNQFPARKCKSANFALSGTNAQHTFHQWLHQASLGTAVEFIGVAQPNHGLSGHHDKLIANLLAQAEALAMGTDGNGNVNRACPGNRPSTTILLKILDPKRLGMLLALYEHKVFVQGVIWGVNSFDQFGVELGKKLAARLLPDISEAPSSARTYDSSTAGLLARYRSWRGYPE